MRMIRYIPPLLFGAVGAVVYQNQRKITIREEQPNDQKSVYDIHTSSFPTKGEAALVNVLRNVDGSLSYVAEEKNRIFSRMREKHIIGHVLFSRMRKTSKIIIISLLE
eukprot:UN12302